MSLASKIPGLSLLSSSRTNLVREAWDRVSGLPGGKRLFSRLVGSAAPYTSTIGARVEVLRTGHAEVTMSDRRSVRNHLRCVHAVALVNLAELTGNVALAYSMPDDARFIVAGLEIEYLKKARGTIVASCDCPVPASSARTEYEVPVSLKNLAGEEVARVKLRSLVGPKQAERSKSKVEARPAISAQF